MIRFSAAAWTAILAQTTAAGRAQALATLNPTTIEFLDAAATVIRTVTTGTWTVSGANAVPGTYTDAGTGGGTPAAAVFKASGTEVMRMSCGTLAGSDYLLLANIVASVKIRRGSFAITFLDPPGAGTSEPAATVAPVISGTAQVGQTLTATAGTWTGNPVPTITRQWYRGASAISGATGLFYTLVSADAGAIISFVETGTNAVGSVTSTSNTLGPVVAADLNADAVPNPVNIDLSSSFDFAPYIVGGVPPYRVAVGAGYSLPSGASLPGTGTVLTVDGTVATGLTADFVFDIDDSAVAATLPTFGVLSSVGGADLPFAFGHVFKQGDVPAGSYVDSDLTDWQCVPTTTWPDGSLRHAIIAGRATCTQNVRKDITLEVSGTDRTGTALTEANLASALPTVTIQGGAHTTTLNSLVGTAAKHRTVCTGPIMSNWIYRHAVTSSNHLVVWIDVRLYKGGRVEIFPWVENAYLTVANPTNDVRTWTVTIGGTQVFSQSIDIKHHTRIPLISGSAFSYWTTDPGIVPVHDTDYMMASKMVPNYGWTSPSSATLDALQQTYTPNTLAGISTGMGAGGGSAYILNHADAMYAATGDARAWRASQVFGMSGGSWSCHYRDSTTNDPFKFSDYPSASIQVQDSPVVPPGTGGTNGTHVISHQPSYGYLQWLTSGRWFFLDEMLFWGGYNYLFQAVANRVGVSGTGANGVIKPNAGANTDRGAAWGLRTLAQGLVALPDSHPCRASLLASWEANTAWYKATSLDGTVDAGANVNALGIFPFYGSFSASVYGTANSSTEMYGAGWMQSMIVQVLGFTWDLALPQNSASELRHEAIRDFGYTQVVNRAGDGSGTTWNYRNFIVYGLNWGEVGGTWYSSWADAYPLYKAGFGIANDDDGGTSLFAHSSQTVLAPGSSSLPYFGQSLTALAYAVDHGFAGASAGWNRIVAASNYATYTEAEFNDAPQHGIVPRSI